jgi:hypothetical protein
MPFACSFYLFVLSIGIDDSLFEDAREDEFHPVE